MKAPSFWYRPAGALASLLMPLGCAYAAATAYRLSSSHPYRPKTPVICVGNITAGGAGKTPTALALAQLLQKLGHRPAFVSRGYGGRLTGPTKVDPARHAAADVGDEPLVLARQAPVWISRNRAAAAKEAEKQSTILILDDGLQNPSVAKDLSILVIDGETGIGNGLCIPAGPLREPFAAALQRVQALIIIGPEDKQNLAAQASCPVFRADFIPTNLDDLPRDKPFLAFAGIGRPEKFYATCHKAGLTLAATRDFSDHHAFWPSDLNALTEESQRLEAMLLTTEKDYARLPLEFAKRVYVLRVNLVIDNQQALSDLLKKVCPPLL
ncbi:MAG: tetraacyldisaccharide 4'-kinase [Bdellovibrionales bacterium]